MHIWAESGRTFLLKSMKSLLQIHEFLWTVVFQLNEAVEALIIDFSVRDNLSASLLKIE